MCPFLLDHIMTSLTTFGVLLRVLKDQCTVSVSDEAGSEAALKKPKEIPSSARRCGLPAAGPGSTHPSSGTSIDGERESKRPFRRWTERQGSSDSGSEACPPWIRVSGHLLCFFRCQRAFSESVAPTQSFFSPGGTTSTLYRQKRCLSSYEAIKSWR